MKNHPAQGNPDRVATQKPLLLTDRLTHRPFRLPAMPSIHPNDRDQRTVTVTSFDNAV